MPVFHAWINVGHGGTYNDAGGGWFGEVAVDWLDWRLKGDKQAGKTFDGPDCTLCKNPILHVEKNSAGQSARAPGLDCYYVTG